MTTKKCVCPFCNMDWTYSREALKSKGPDYLMPIKTTSGELAFEEYTCGCGAIWYEGMEDVI